LTELAQVKNTMRGGARRNCEARLLARISYADGLDLQRKAVEECAETGLEQLLLLEHPHVITLGRAGNQSHVLLDEATLTSLSIEIHHTGRGGDVTYHGPGQLVGYPILNLRPDRCDVHRYVRDLEEVLIRSLSEYGIAGTRVQGLTGVWVGGQKIGAIGVRIARWITSHGFALNVNTDLSYFGTIIPCGIADRGVTSISRMLGGDLEIGQVSKTVAQKFAEVFSRELVYSKEEHHDQNI
jgi:lipoyl(octanoyl) transferase